MADLVTVQTGFKATFQRGFDGVTPTWNRVATPVPSSTAEEEYGWLRDIPAMREWVGDRVVHQLAEHGYKIRNKDFELTVSVHRNHIEDDRFGIYGPMFENLGYEAAVNPDRLVFQALMDGFASACYDGQYFFDTDHPVIAADGSTTTVSNDGGGSGSYWFLLDTRRPIKPILFQQRQAPIFVAKDDPADDNVFRRKVYEYGVDVRYNVGYGFWQMAYGSRATLDAASFAAARAAMGAFKADGGRPLGVTGNLLLTGPANEEAALEIAQAQRNAAGASNVWAGKVEVMISPWLT